MDSDNTYKKITGWLWIPAIGLIISPVSFIIGSIVPLFQDHFPFRISVDYIILVADLILFGLMGILAWFFFKRKKHTPIIYIIFILFMVLLWEIIDGVHESQNDPPFIAMIFYCLAIVPLFILSKRTDRTFVKKLSGDIFIEKFIMPVSSFLCKFYNLLKRSKYFIFLIMIIFIFLGILLNCALRSYRIDGDLFHTFDYL